MEKNIVKLIYQNSFWLGITEVISKLVGFLILIWLARYFGPELYGKWSFALAFVTIFSVVADFGLSTLTVREIARDKSKTEDYILNITFLKIILGILSLVLMALAINFIKSNDPETIKLVYFLGIYIILNTFAAFFESIFRANEKMQYEAICRISQSILLLILTSLFIFKKSPILNISFAYISGALFGTILSFIFLLKYFFSRTKKPKINFQLCKKILLESWPFGLSTVAIFLYNYFDQTMLGIMKTNREVGLYSAAFRIIFTFQVFGDILSIAFFPQLSKKYKEKLADLKEIFSHFQKTILICVLPLSLLLFFFAQPILFFLYGKEYIEATTVFQILTVAMAILLFSFPFSEVLKATDRQKTYLFGIGSGATLNVILNFLFIPSFGMTGAAIATLISEIYVLIFMWLKVKNLWKISLKNQ
ncbi:MAG TPA: flippase [Candidatus Pacearchaeota archaeon]|nr:flippase [Candidatus Pacearchaeota archaeon]HOK94128.1 flippase [Candidatus Pacearchaeota archaeon]HPO75256.1 flippase [Candidatus Pacearchaeota archaeon]